MSPSANSASQGAGSQPPAALMLLGRVGVFVLAYAVAVAGISASLATVVLPVPVAVLFPKPPTVVARTPTLSTSTPERKP